MSKSTKRLKETLADAQAMIPDDGLILTREEVNRLVYALGGWQRLKEIIYPDEEKKDGP